MKLVTFEESKSLNNVDKIVENLLPNGLSKVDSEQSVTDNTFYFDRNENRIVVKSGANKLGIITIMFDDVDLGDIIELECEMRWISGAKPHVKIEHTNADHINGQVELLKETHRGTGEWIYHNQKITQLVENKSINVNFGLGLGDDGSYELRNVKAKVIRQKPSNVREVRAYAFYKMPNTGWQIRTDVWDSDTNAVLTKQDSQTLSLTFPRFRKTPIPCVAENFSNNGQKYDIRIGECNVDVIKIKVVDRETNQFVALDSLSDYFNFYLTLHGYSYV